MAIIVENKNLEKVKELLSQSNLSDSDQRNLLEALSGAEDSELEAVAMLFSEDASWIERVSKNFQLKKAAFSSQDSAAWQDILKEELSQLEEVKD